MAEALFWPAILGYGEAAIAYSSPRATRALATWGVRLGWLAQTALLAVQAARVDGFPWSTLGRLAQPVRLARRRRLPDLGLPAALPARSGLTVMPLAALLFVAARVGGGTAAGERSHYGNLFLDAPRRLRARRLRRLHARRRARRRSTCSRSDGCKRRAADILPAAAAVARRARAADGPHDRDLAAAPHRRARRRVRAAARAAATAFDALMAATIVTWLVYAAFLAIAADRAPGRLPRARRVRARDPRPRRPRREPLLSALARRHLPPRRAGRAARAGRAPARRAPPRSPARSATPSASRPATAPRSTSRATTDRGRSRRSRSSPASRSRSVAYRMHDDAAALHLFRVSAGLDSLDPGRERDPRPGAGRLRRRRARAAARPRLPAGAPARQARPDRDGDRREPGVGSRGRRGARGAGVRRPLAAARCCSSAPAGSASSRPANLSARGATIAYVANRTRRGGRRARRPLRR